MKLESVNQLRVAVVDLIKIQQEMLNRLQLISSILHDISENRETSDPESKTTTQDTESNRQTSSFQPSPSIEKEFVDPGSHTRNGEPLIDNKNVFSLDEGRQPETGQEPDAFDVLSKHAEPWRRPYPDYRDDNWDPDAIH